MDPVLVLGALAFGAVVLAVAIAFGLGGSRQRRRQAEAIEEARASAREEAAEIERRWNERSPLDG